jgi:DNA modification methylase
MIYHGNCLDVMKRIPDNTYSAIVTDPPYAIDLLGKDWDKCLPDERYWKEALRIVKPGGYIFAFGGSRTFHRLCVKIEDSGWIIKDMFLWLYGSAMAKSHDISKAIDEHLGAEREEIIVSGSKARNPKASGGGKQKKQGTRPFIERAKKRGYHVMKSDKPVTTQAMDFDGYGTGLRPSHEPIIVAMKPLDKNYHTNALKHGVSGLDIQGNRTGDDDITVSHNKGNAYSHSYGEKGTKPTPSHKTQHKGRHPANVVIDPIIAAQFKRIANADRYFYVAKPTKKEKGYFNNHPSVKPLELMRYLLRLLKQPNNATYILDPFCGSGSTIVASEQLGIRCDGIEMNEEYIEIINSRIENIKKMKEQKKSSKITKKHIVKNKRIKKNKK